MFNVKGTFFIKKQQIQFQNRIKNNRKQKQKKRDTRKKTKQKILHNFNKTHEEILKVGVQKFLGCHRLYLRKAKSLRKRPLEKDS